MKNIVTTLYILFSLSISHFSYSQSTLYTITEIPTMEGLYAYINDQNLVAGTGVYQGSTRTVVWDQESIDWLDTGDLGTASSGPRAINANGVVVGDTYITLNGPSVPAYWSGGSMFMLGTEPGWATGVNDFGQMVGHVFVNRRNQAVAWDNGIRSFLFANPGPNSYAVDINNSGVITGNDENGAFIYDNGLTVSYGSVTLATAINNVNQIAGYAVRQDGSTGAFTTDGSGNYVELSMLPDHEHGYGLDINDSGEIVGQSTKNSIQYATLWSPQYGVINLNDQVLDSSAWFKLHVATSINNSGVIVGVGSLADGRGIANFQLTPVSPTNVIIDNDDSNAGPGSLWIPIYGDITFFIPGVGLDWNLLTEASDKYGQDYYLLPSNENTGDKTFNWTFSVANSGTYNVDAWWPTNSASTFSASYQIESEGSSTTVILSQAINGGNWNSLGSFYFVEGVSYKVSLSAPAGEQVIADAIRISN